MPTDASSGGSRLPLIGALVAVLAVVGIGAFVVLSGGGDDATDAAASESSTTEGADAEGDGSTDTTVEAPATSQVTTATPMAPPSDAAMVSAVSGVIDELFSTVEATIDGEGEVTLTGRAFDEDEAAAVLVAVDMDGVTNIVNEMEIQTEDERCTDTVQAQPNFGCITSADWDGTNIVGTYYSSADAGGPALSISGGHLHLYANSFTKEEVGVPGDFSTGGGTWQVYDTPMVITVSLGQLGVTEVPEKLCSLIANQNHTIEGFNSGTCWPVTDLTLADAAEG